MSRTYDCRADAPREEGLRTAATVIGRGGLVVFPTDTLYGVAGDAFNPAAVSALLAAKGRERSMPPPVLIAGIDVLAALTTDLPPPARRLAEAFWPGGLTLIGWAQPSLAWDLGDTGGTVAVRVPDHPVALALLRSCGPLATSSANLSGRPPAATAVAARDQLGSDVEVYLEVGELDAAVPSTIVDATTDRITVVREGAISLDQLREVVPDVLGLGESSTAGETGPAGQRPGDSRPGAGVRDPDVTPAPAAAASPPTAQGGPTGAEGSGVAGSPFRADSTDGAGSAAVTAASGDATAAGQSGHYDARAEYRARHLARETPTES